MTQLTHLFCFWWPPPGDGSAVCETSDTANLQPETTHIICCSVYARVYITGHVPRPCSQAPPSFSSLAVWKSREGLVHNLMLACRNRKSFRNEKSMLFNQLTTHPMLGVHKSHP